MKIIRLQAENFKRLKAIDITPGEGIIRVAGKNASGKSSVLDTIFAAFGGADADPRMPVRAGEERATIKLDLGPVNVVKTYDADGKVTLKVETAEGAKYSRAQTMLDDLVGRISFDPMAFTRMPPKLQAVELRKLVTISVDLDALKADDDADVVTRRDINRDVKALTARRDALPEIDGLPDEAPDRSAILAEMRTAAETNAANDREDDRRNAVETENFRTLQRRDSLRAEAQRNREEAERLIVVAGDQESKAEELDAEVAASRAAIAALPELPAPIDLTELEASAAKAERTAALVAQRDQRAALTAELTAEEARSDALTKAIQDRAELRTKALVEAVMPVPGMSLATGDDIYVTLDGVPFEQASSAQQLRASTLLAMAANPKLRVLRIKDGGLLDSDGLALLAEMAEAGSYQIWLEMVAEDGLGIIMEDGAVKGAAVPEPMNEGPKRRPKAAAEAVADQDPTKLL